MEMEKAEEDQMDLGSKIHYGRGGWKENSRGAIAGFTMIGRDLRTDLGIRVHQGLLTMLGPGGSCGLWRHRSRGAGGAGGLRGLGHRVVEGGAMG